jgi:integrase
LFALRWRDIDETARVLTVRQSIYDGVVSTPKTEAGSRRSRSRSPRRPSPASGERGRSGCEPDAFVFATRQGHALLPNNVLRRIILPTCNALGLPRATWLTFRRTYASWSHDKGVSGKVVAQLMGYTNVDTTLNIYTQVLDGSVRTAVETVGDELFTIVHKPQGAGTLSH